MNRPEEFHSRFVAAFNSGNIDAIMALYEMHASLVSQPGQVVQGREAIRQATLQFLALKGTIQIKSVFTVHGPGVALTRGQWKLSGTGPDGKSVEMTGQNVEVLREQPNGEWLAAIDHPFGAQRNKRCQEPFRGAWRTGLRKRPSGNTKKLFPCLRLNRRFTKGETP